MLLSIAEARNRIRKHEWNKQFPVSPRTNSTSTSSSISVGDVQNFIDRMRNERHRESTKKGYYNIWKNFNLFCIKLDYIPENWEERVILYAGYLIQQDKKSSTVRSYVSAIRAVLMSIDVELNENKFLLSSLTRACKYKNDRVKTRLPIYKKLLNQVIGKIYDHFENEQQHYLAVMYCAMFASAYYGLLRVGEVSSGTHPILATDVQIATNKKKIKFILHMSKTHWFDSKPRIIIIKSKENNKKHKARDIFCPYYLLRMYSKLRPTCTSLNEPFFVFGDRTPVKPHHLRKILKLGLELAGFRSSLYDTHSLRIGAASNLLAMGISVEMIKKLGRWKSNAVYAYLHS